MKISTDKPPIWAEAHKHFKIDDAHTYYTYGDTLYNPARIPIPDHIVEHEEHHSRQQLALEGGPAAWWARYFVDADFRFQQEAEAYGKQYRFACKHIKDRNAQARFLHEIAQHLSSGMYNAGRGLEEAKAQIRKLSKI